MFNFHYTSENCHLGLCMNETYGDIYLIFTYENYEDDMWFEPKRLLVTNAEIYTTENTKMEIKMYFMNCIDNYVDVDGEKYHQDIIELLKGEIEYTFQHI